MEASESDEGSGGDDNGPGPPDHLVAHPLLAARTPETLLRHLVGEDSDELAPRVSRELCRFVVDEIYDGDVEEAVDTLLHVPAAELESRRAEATERRLAMEAKEAMRAKLAKRRVLSRHARVRDHVADGESVFDLCKPHVKAYVASRKQALATPAIRYLEGAVVSRSGEREIVERAPAWDGGSRGRIVASQRSHYTPREPPTRAPDPGAGKKGR